MKCPFSGLALEVLIQKVCAGAKCDCAGRPCAPPHQDTFGL